MVITAALKVPAQDGSLVEIDHLPEDLSGLLQFLESEGVPLGFWWDLARAYLAQGQTAQYLALLQSALDEELLQAVEDFFKRRPTFEIVQLQCGYVAHHIEQARREQDKAAKAQHLAEAAARVAAAKKEGPQEQLPYLAAGCLALARGDTNAAMAEFRQAASKLHNGRPNVSGLLGQAGLHFNAGRYSEALELYKTALRRNPAAPAEVRLGLAACYFRAGQMVLAQTAYERVLELDPDNADALLGLATLHLNSRSVQQGLASATELLARAYRADPAHPGVLASLGHFLLLQGNYQRALDLADTALQCADTEALRAFATTLRARAAHALGQLAEAEQGYVASIRLDAKAPLPHLGLAQMYARKGEFLNATSELEAALTLAGPDADALRLLGALAPELPDRIARRAPLFKEAAAKRPEDAELAEVLGELLSGTDPKAALEAFESALQTHRTRTAAAAAAADLSAGADGTQGQEQQQPHAVPPKLLNNAAVLKYRAGAVHEALALAQEAVANMGAGGLSAANKITLGYNVARLKEAAGDLKAATAEYKALIDNFPSYVDCYLRLACIARTAGDMPQAVEWARRATKAGGDAVDANALLATLYLERSDYEAAKKCLDEILRPPPPGTDKANGAAAGRDDAYAKLALANLYLRSMAQGKTPEARQKARHNLDRAQALYRAVLRAQPSNAYAANGLGVVLAETGHLDAAREAFLLVQQAAVSSQGFMQLPDVYINQANIALAKQAYEPALALYDRASAAHQRKNAQFLLYTARAHYDKDDLAAAKRALTAAIHVAPGDPKLRFNLALCLQEWAVRTFKRQRPEGDPTKVADYEEATERLMQAHATFVALQAMGREASRVEPKKLQVHVDFCTRTHALAMQHVASARREAVVLEAKRVNYEESLKAQAAATAEEEMRAQAAKEAFDREKAAQAAKLRDEFAVRLEGWQQRKAAAAENPEEDGGGKGSKSKKRRRKGGKERDDLIADEEGGRGGGSSDDDGEAAALRRAGLASDSDGGDAGGGGSDRDDLFGSSGEEEEEGGGGGGGGDARERKARKEKKRRDKSGGGGGGGEKASGGRLKRRTAAAGGGSGDDAAAAGAGGFEDFEDIFGEGEGDGGNGAAAAEDERAGGPAAAAAAGGGGGDEKMEDADVASPQGGAAGGGGGGDGSARKRGRHGAVAFSDSEEEGAAE